MKLVHFIVIHGFTVYSHKVVEDVLSILLSEEKVLVDLHNCRLASSDRSEVVENEFSKLFKAFRFINFHACCHNKLIYVANLLE